MPIDSSVTVGNNAQVVEDLNTYNKQKESTWGDYWAGLNPYAISLMHPELQTDAEDLSNPQPLDLQDEDVQALLNDSSPEARHEIVNAYSKEHAMKIYAKNKLREEALHNIEGDPLTTQLAMGAIPAIVTPSSMLPAGVLMDVFKVGKTAYTLSNVARAAGAAGLAAGTMAATDELLFEQQGISGHPLSAFAYGAIFGGGVGALSGMFANTLARENADLLMPQSDTYKYDWTTDPDIIVNKDNRGVPWIEVKPQGVPENAQYLRAKGTTSVQRMRKIPGVDHLFGWLNSDITKIYQSPSSVAREITSKLVAPVQSMKDAVGNIVVFGKTANDFKISRRGVVNTLKHSLKTAYGEAKESFGYVGSFKDFGKEVSELYLQTSNKQSKELYEYVNAGLNKFDNEYGDVLTKYLDEEVSRQEKGKKPLGPEDDALALMGKAEAYRMKQRNALKKQLHDEFYQGYKIKFEHPIQAVAKAAEAYHNFFVDHLRTNKQLGMKGVEDIGESHLYAPRLIDWDKFKNNVELLKQLEEDVFRALKEHPANDDMLDEELSLLAKEYVETMSTVDFRQNFTHGSFIAPSAPGTARLENRKFMLDTSIMQKYWLNDMSELADRYHYQMTGRQAVTYGLGIDVGNKGALDEFMNSIRTRMLEEEGMVDDNVVTMLENTILDLSGQLRMNALSDSASWQFTRGAMAYNSARLGGGFGGNQAIEAIAASMLSGLTNVIKSGRVGKSFKNAARVLYTDTKRADEFAEFLIETGYFEDALHTSRINRFADTEAGWNSSKIESTLNGFTDWMYKYNGMRYFKTMTEDMSGAAVIQEIQHISKKGILNEMDIKRLANMGLDEVSMKELSSELNELVNLKEGKFNIQQMSQLNRDRLQLAITRQMEQVIIQGDSIHLPTWFKVPNEFKSLVTQFMRFPLIAHNIYLRKGLTDEQARTFGAILSSSMMFMGMKYLREQAAISLGLMNPMDARYDYFDKYKGEENLQRGLLQSTNYLAPLGMFSSIANGGLMSLGLPSIGSDYRGKTLVQQALGPTASAAQDMLEIMNEAMNDNYSSERTMLKAKGLFTPNFMFLDEGLKSWVKENY